MGRPGLAGAAGLAGASSLAMAEPEIAIPTLKATTVATPLKANLIEFISTSERLQPSLYCYSRITRISRRVRRC
jgi:hypothetical protein